MILAGRALKELGHVVASRAESSRSRARRHPPPSRTTGSGAEEDSLPGGRAHYPGANGVKAGYTESRLYCLAFSVRRREHSLVGEVQGDPSADARDTDA